MSVDMACRVPIIWSARQDRFRKNACTSSPACYARCNGQGDLVTRAWTLPLTLDLEEDANAEPTGASSAPLFLRIARALVAEVRRGRLKPGGLLPGTRPLAEQLGVHRNTVVAAYDELRAEGWIESRPGGGT